MLGRLLASNKAAAQSATSPLAPPGAAASQTAAQAAAAAFAAVVAAGPPKGGKMGAIPHALILPPVPAAPQPLGKKPPTAIATATATAKPATPGGGTKGSSTFASKASTFTVVGAKPGMGPPPSLKLVPSFVSPSMLSPAAQAAAAASAAAAATAAVASAGRTDPSGPGALTRLQLPAPVVTSAPALGAAPGEAARAIALAQQHMKAMEKSGSEGAALAAQSGTALVSALLSAHANGELPPHLLAAIVHAATASNGQMTAAPPFPPAAAAVWNKGRILSSPKGAVTGPGAAAAAAAAAMAAAAGVTDIKGRGRAKIKAKTPKNVPRASPKALKKVAAASAASAGDTASSGAETPSTSSAETAKPTVVVASAVPIIPQLPGASTGTPTSTPSSSQPSSRAASPNSMRSLPPKKMKAWKSFSAAAAATATATAAAMSTPAAPAAVNGKQLGGSVPAPAIIVSAAPMVVAAAVPATPVSVAVPVAPPPIPTANTCIPLLPGPAVGDLKPDGQARQQHWNKRARPPSLPTDEVSHIVKFHSVSLLFSLSCIHVCFVYAFSQQAPKS